MSNPQPKLSTAPEMLSSAKTSRIIEDAVAAVRTECVEKRREDTVREQQNWAAVGNQIVGAESLGFTNDAS